MKKLNNAVEIARCSYASREAEDKQATTITEALLNDGGYFILMYEDSDEHETFFYEIDEEEAVGWANHCFSDSYASEIAFEIQRAL